MEGFKKDCQMFTDPTALAELHPDLQPYVSETAQFEVLKHPLVFQVPFRNHSLANSIYLSKVEGVKNSRGSKDWSRYIILHERPYRLMALLEVANSMTDRDYWKQLAFTWIDSENIYEDAKTWNKLLSSPRGGRQHMMTKQERTALANMDSTITIYRGAGRKDPFPMAWSLSMDRAQWFARRHRTLTGRPANVYQSTVQKEHVAAYFTGRGEDEIIVPLDMATNITRMI